MATENDVVLGSRWRAHQKQNRVTGPFVEGAVFTIVEVDSEGAAYIYDGGVVRSPKRTLQKFLQHAELLVTPTCTADCSPADPCKAAPACPGLRPEYTGKLGFKEWSERQAPRRVMLTDKCIPPFGSEPYFMPFLHRFWGNELWSYPRGPEPMRNGSGALACDWIQRRG